MHWWKFLALFMDLGSETTFCNLVGLRKRVKNGTASKEEKQAAREMGDLFEIPEPDTRTPDERDQEQAFLALVSNGGN
jgi:predicted membrane GTPase involved in stress response